MKKIILVAIILGLVSACKTNTKADNTENAKAESVESQQADIPFLVAERYFVNNTVDDQTYTLKITNEKDFDNYFGKAPVMGQGGTPTEIDFSKQYVIAVIVPKTDNSTTITPIELSKQGENILFSYQVSKGEKQSFTIRPALAIVVNNDYTGNIEFKEQ